MPACCILIAIILTQIAATVRRWGIFWGVVRPEAGEIHDTLAQRVRQWLSLPRVKSAVFAVAALELVGVGSWAYVAHGSHLYRLGDVAIGHLVGREVVYVGVCNRSGDDRYVRLVIDRSRYRLS
ncbi:MAG: hypothetical protein NVS3B5_08970 [Sphingomicrobium sp.]